MDLEYWVMWLDGEEIIDVISFDKLWDTCSAAQRVPVSHDVSETFAGRDSGDLACTRARSPSPAATQMFFGGAIGTGIDAMKGWQGSIARRNLPRKEKRPKAACTEPN
jgi:hypothetical protein